MTCPELSPTLGGKTYAEWLAMEKAARMVKKAFGGWLPRSEHTNVPHDMTDALAALFAALDCLHTWTPAYDNQWVCQKCGLRMEAKCGGATALAGEEKPNLFGWYDGKFHASDGSVMYPREKP